MKLSVRTRGGLFGVDRVVEIDGTEASVSESGRSHPVLLDRANVDRLSEAATRVAGSGPGPGQGSAAEAWEDANDGGYSDIEIWDGQTRTSLRVAAGVPAPDAVWDLLDLVEEVAQRDAGDSTTA